MDINKVAVKDGVITNSLIIDENITEWGGELLFPALPDTPITIGMLYEEYTSAQPPVLVVEVPTSVQRRQAKLWMLSAGILEQVDMVIAAIPDPIQRAVAQIEWQDAPDFLRHSVLIVTLGAALGLSDEQLDQAFIAAQSL